MATVTVTNLTSSPLAISDIYTTIAASGSVEFERAVSDIPRMVSLQKAVAAGSAAVSIALSADEIASGLTAVDSTVQAADMAPVAAADAVAPLITIRKTFAAGAAGAADDVTIFAAGAVPYKMRILDAHVILSAASAGGGQLLQVRSAVAGAGTLLAEMSSAVTGRAGMTATVTASQVVTAADALVVRRLNRDAAGEVVIVARRES